MTIYYTKLDVAGTVFNYYALYYGRDSSKFLGCFSCAQHPTKRHLDLRNLQEKLTNMVSFLSPYKLELEPTEVQVQKRAKEIYR